jgi:hypothetical protein
MGIDSEPLNTIKIHDQWVAKNIKQFHKSLQKKSLQKVTLCKKNMMPSLLVQGQRV